MLGCASHICRKHGQKTAPPSSRTWGSCRRTVCALFETGFRKLSHLGEVEVCIHTLSSTRTNDGPVCGGAASTLIVAESLMALIDHSVVVLCLASRTVSPGCASFFSGKLGPFVRCQCRASPGCENHLRKGECAPLLLQRVAPNRVPERRIHSNTC